MKKARVKLSLIVWTLFAALFAVAGAVQFNDPDTGRWVAFYFAAAAVAGLWPHRGRLPWRAQLGLLVLAFAVEIVAVLWMMLWLPDVVRVGTVDFGEEAQREFGGLLIVAVAMSFAVSSARRSTAAISVLMKAKRAKG